MGNRTGKRVLNLFILLAAAALLPGAAFSAGFMQPSVEYSADRVMSTESGSMTGKVYSAPEKERMDLKEGGGVVNIVRMDKKVMWTLMPSEKKYMEHKFSEQKGKREKGDYQDCDVRQTDAGKEEVNGFPTRKMATEISCPGNDKFTGTFWLTKENIPIRMETSKAGSKKDMVRIELKNLKIGKQDPSLFEIPAGYTAMVVPSFGDIQNMMNQQRSMQEKAERDAAAKEEARRQKEEARKAEAAKQNQGRAYTAAGRSYSSQPREEPKTAVDVGIDSAKKLKNLLGW
jgi:hypothetical protein